MESSTEQVHWLVKVLQPEQSGLAPDVYAGELARLQAGANEAALKLLSDPNVSAMVDRLPLRKGAKVVAFGDSRTSDPQSWAVILREMLAARRPADGISVILAAVSGETTTHALVRFGEVVASDPDWVLFFIGLNDARMHGPNPTKTIVDHEETARNLAELRHRAAQETKARRLWITPPAVIEDRVSRHWAWSRFGVRFRNENVARVAEAVHAIEDGDSTIDLFASLGAPALDELLMEDGLHFTLAGQERLALDVIRGWSELARD